jgi:hypothetical protein
VSYFTGEEETKKTEFDPLIEAYVGFFSKLPKEKQKEKFDELVAEISASWMQEKP